MSRIPDDEVSCLKQAVRLDRLAALRGLALERAGGDEVKALCCFHAEQTPSLSIDTAANVFHCFGCGAKGDVIAWVRRLEGLSFPAAVAWLQAVDGTGVPPVATAGPPAAGRRGAACPIGEASTGAALLGEVAGYYHQVLMADPLATAGLARDYLERRRVWDAGVVRRLLIGFDDRSLGTRLPAKAWKAGAAVRGNLEAAGLYRPSGHGHFVGCVTFPIADADSGAVVGMYGRRAQKNVQGIRHVNLPGERRGVWNAAGCRAAVAANGGALILCEAVIDALSFVVHGQGNATACLGTTGWTDDLRAFVRGCAREVFIAFDRDAAGDAAYPAIAEELIGAGLSVYRVQFPPGMDANAVACTATDPGDALASYLRTAVWLGGAPRVVVADVAALAPKTAPASAAEEEALAAVAVATAAPVAAADASSAADAFAAAVAPAPPAALPPGVGESGPDEVSAVFGARRWWARGWRANTSYDRMKVALRVRVGDRVCGDNVDVAGLKARAAFVAAAAAETDQPADVLKDDLGRLWLALETLQDRRIREVTTPAAAPDPVAAMPADRRAAALALLGAPDLLARIGADIAACGLVGEAMNALVLYLAAVSRKLPDPLAVLVQASSAAGKSSVQDTVLSLIPDSDRYDLAAVSSRALFYVEGDALRHKALSIAEEEGAQGATYSLKLMQSAGKLSIAVPVKDPETGEMATKTRTVDGPVALFMTTTAAEVNDELQNRFLVLTVDESAGQTAAVQAAQRMRETRAGYAAARRAAAVRQLHHDAQHLLDPAVRVFNPYAPRLTFAAGRTRTRRDHAKYLRLIRVLAFLRQHQRVRKTEVIEGARVVFIESTLEDIADANRIFAAILGRSLDELAP